MSLVLEAMALRTALSLSKPSDWAQTSKVSAQVKEFGERTMGPDIKKWCLACPKKIKGDLASPSVGQHISKSKYKGRMEGKINCDVMYFSNH